MFESILQFGGRLHPMVLHAPIGLVIGLLVLEVIGLARRRPLGREVRLGLVWLTALTAAVSIGTGLLLNRAGGYPEKTVWLHQWLAIGTGGVIVLAAIAAQARRITVYALLVGVAGGLLVPAGHFGASMTHGDDFLLEPFQKRDRAESVSTATTGPTASAVITSDRSTYARVIAPIFADHCINCHGATKHKGGLSLHLPQAIVAGGDSGVPIVPGDLEASELIRRINLPIDDDEHMPPRSKDQLEPEELKTLELWIRSGASFESASDSVSESAALTGPSAELAPGPAPADAGAIAAIRDRLVHVEPVARGSALLVVDAAAVSGSIGDAEVAALFKPIGGQISDLSLTRSRITDSSMALIASMPNLRRLNIGDTTVGDAGLRHLASHPALEEIVITRTAATSDGLAVMASLPKLKRVYAWGAHITPEGVGVLRHARGDVVVDTGEFEDAGVIEAESEIAVSAAPQPTATPSLKAVNMACPVSGKPVDEGYLLVYKGRIIGFCCRHCLGQFLEDPAKFESKLN